MREEDKGLSEAAVLARLDNLTAALANSQPVIAPPQPVPATQGLPFTGAQLLMWVGGGLLALIMFVYTTKIGQLEEADETTQDKIEEVAGIVGNLATTVGGMQQTQNNRAGVIDDYKVHSSETALLNQRQDNRLDAIEASLGIRSVPRP